MPTYDHRQPTLSARKLKIPAGYAHAGMFGRVVACRETEIDLHIFRECRSTMRGPVSRIVTVPRAAFVGVA